MKMLNDILGPEKATLALFCVLMAGIFFGAAVGWTMRGLWRN